MSAKDKSQTDLFGEAPLKFEYYPVLLPDEDGMAAIALLNQRLIELGVKPSGLTKLPHVSIDGIICPENDTKVSEGIVEFLSKKDPLLLEFSEMSYFPNPGGLTLIMPINNAEAIKAFNQEFMNAIGGKITKLKLHLTLARYVSREIFDILQNSDISFPKNCLCKSVAIYKKQYKAKGAYEVIGKLPFGV
ncbi:MAG TPA: 2'-5' RNA ligase family protein [Leadbetterella sp.]|nr:2'-5' RNA ligase family protein [Leadbetterella sp.]